MIRSPTSINDVSGALQINYGEFEMELNNVKLLSNKEIGLVSAGVGPAGAIYGGIT